MPPLKQSETETLKKAFDTGQGLGYVLDFSDRTFKSYFHEEFGLDLDQPRYCPNGKSKGKRLQAFLTLCDGKAAADVLQSLWERRAAILSMRGDDETPDLSDSYAAIVYRLQSNAPASVKGSQRTPQQPVAEPSGDRTAKMQHTLFFSYSHVDEDLRDHLDIHLASLKRQGVISAWHDRKITAGSNFAEAIDENLESSSIILLLVSPHFIASDYCYEREVTLAMERHSRSEACVIPVILKPCDWHGLPFGSLLAAPRDGKPVTTWTNIDEAFLNVVQAVKAAIQGLGAREPTNAPRKMASTTAIEAIVTSKKGQDASEATLSELERKLLIAASKDRDGSILHGSTFDGYFVQANGVSFGEDTPRQTAALKESLKNLEDFAYISTKSDKMYEITRRGFARADKEVAQLQLAPDRPAISLKGLELLNAAIVANGNITCRSFIGGEGMYAGSKNFLKSNDSRGNAEWREALQELVKKELITGLNEALYKVTAAGYRLAE